MGTIYLSSHLNPFIRKCNWSDKPCRSRWIAVWQLGKSRCLIRFRSLRYWPVADTVFMLALDEYENLHTRNVCERVLIMERGPRFDGVQSRLGQSISAQLTEMNSSLSDAIPKRTDLEKYWNVNGSTDGRADGQTDIPTRTIFWDHQRWSKSNDKITKAADLYQTRIPSEQTLPLHHRLLVLLVLRRLGRPWLMPGHGTRMYLNERPKY